SLDAALASRVSALASGKSSGDWWGSVSPDGSSLRTCQQSLDVGAPPSPPTLPRSGMIVSGSAYRLAPLVRLISVTAGGALPTLWPTPTAVDGKRGTGTYRSHDTGIPLPQAVAMAEQFATPMARDWRSGKVSPATMEKNARPLSEQVGGTLNPTWVEWLMGYPAGWTVCDALETPSSRKSRK
ncbi:MAG: hypothetical protein AAGF32_03400, partial [Pseudomonadota bacterium]